MLHFYNAKNNSMTNNDEKNILGIQCLYSQDMEL